jgi:hypothetical protein
MQSVAIISFYVICTWAMPTLQELQNSFSRGFSHLPVVTYWRHCKTPPQHDLTITGVFDCRYTATPGQVLPVLNLL